MTAAEVLDTFRDVATYVLATAVAAEWAGYRIAELNEEKALKAVGYDEGLLPDDYEGVWSVIPIRLRPYIHVVGIVALVVAVATGVAGWFV